MILTRFADFASRAMDNARTMHSGRQAKETQKDRTKKKTSEIRRLEGPGIHKRVGEGVADEAHHPEDTSCKEH